MGLAPLLPQRKRAERVRVFPAGLRFRGASLARASRTGHRAIGVLADDHRVGGASAKGGHVAEDQIARAEAAIVALLLLAADDREGAEDIIGGLSIEAV